MTKEAKKEMIAKAALSCFLSAGYSNTTMDDITKTAGISKGGVYWYFKSKEEIFYYIMDLWINEFNAELLRRFRPTDSGREKLEKVMELYLENMETPLTPIIFDFVFQNHKNKGVIDYLVKELFEKRQTVIRKVIAEAIQKGEFRQNDTTAITHFFINMVEGVAARGCFMKDPDLIQRSAQHALDVFFNGILETKGKATVE